MVLFPEVVKIFDDLYAIKLRMIIQIFFLEKSISIVQDIHLYIF